MGIREMILGTSGRWLACVLPALMAQAPLVLAASGAPNAAAEQVASIQRPATSSALSDAALRLNSPRFAEREAASKELIEARAPAVTALLDVAKEGSLEAAVRAVGILEAIYVFSGNLEETTAEEMWCASNDLVRAYFWIDLREAQVTADAAESALDELERKGRPPVSDRAEVVLDSHYEIRERRAISEIERLHGKAIYGGTYSPLFMNGRIIAQPMRIELQREAEKGRGDLSMIVIGPKWTGGDDGLKQVARLKRLRNLYRIEGKQVTDNGILRLRAELPGLEVQVRAAAKLGIEHRPDPIGPVERGCTVDSVKAGEAAANAGLRRGDVILRFAGQPVVTFDSLLEILHHYNPGDTVEALVNRDEVSKTFQITLTGWD
jgi:hypothetical protein